MKAPATPTRVHKIRLDPNAVQEDYFRNACGVARNRSVADAAFSKFRGQLEYKAAMTGAQIVVIDRFFPSSQLCSQCGERHHEMTQQGGFAARMVCRCGCNMDRDENAAINIRRQALAFQSVEREALASAQANTKLLAVKQKNTTRRSNARAC